MFLLFRSLSKACFVYEPRVFLIEMCLFTRKMLVLSVQVGVLLREFSIGDLESVDLSLESGLLGPEGLVLGGEVGILLGEGCIVVLQLSVPLCEVLNNDLGLKMK